MCPPALKLWLEWVALRMHRLILISVHLLAVINRCVILIRCSVEKMKGREVRERDKTYWYISGTSFISKSFIGCHHGWPCRSSKKKYMRHREGCGSLSTHPFHYFPIMSALCDPFYRSPFFTTRISYQLAHTQIRTCHLFLSRQHTRPLNY